MVRLASFEHPFRQCVRRGSTVHACIATYGSFIFSCCCEFVTMRSPSATGRNHPSLQTRFGLNGPCVAKQLLLYHHDPHKRKCAEVFVRWCLKSTDHGHAAVLLCLQGITMPWTQARTDFPERFLQVRSLQLCAGHIFTL
jgi:hypothetical protein